MKRKPPSIISKPWSVSAILTILTLWQLSVSPGLVEGFMLPSPVQIAEAFIKGFPALMENVRITLTRAGMGPVLGIATGFGVAVLMDRFDKAYKAFYPVIVLAQTVPAVTIAPLLVLRFGYEVTPKVTLVVITTFFPITVGLLTGFRATDPDAMNLLKAMGVDRFQIFCYIKLPGAIGQFSSSLKVSASYAVVGAMISEWLGGFGGLGVYMTRAKRAFSFDKMFAVILLISATSLILVQAVELLQRKCMPWETSQRQKQNMEQISDVSLGGEIENEK